MECWYSVVKEQLIIHNYNLLNIWNMNKLGFNINKKQMIKILIHLNNIQKYKIVTGKQEWIINIKYINVTDKAITSTLIFKNKYINI